MNVRDILAIVLSAEADEPALAAAELLGERFDGALGAALLTALPDEPVAYEPSVVAGVWAELLSRARQDAKADREKVEARLARSSRRWDLHTAEALARDLGRVAAVHARYADIAVLTRPGAEESPDPRHDLVEGVLFHSGRPSLIVPPGWKGASIGRRPLLAWDASREATRALSEADWLIEGAEAVTVVTIDAKTTVFGHGDQPGANIAAHLARRGLKTDVRNLDGGGRPAAQAILTEARDRDGDLIIMGGYAHTRLRELMFGGATRDMLEQADVPLLMAH
jgi:nucleotide-binding universal stress UspA family protein